MNKKIIGVIYPVSEKIFECIKKGKNLFLKFPVHEIKKKNKIRLAVGMKIYFYISHWGISSKYPIKGEAVINKLEFCNLDFVKEKYIKKLPISIEELKGYAKGRENKRIMVFHLSRFKEYKTLVFIKKPITMNGLYITSSKKKEIGLLI